MWMYVPNISISSPSAPAEPASISASSWQFHALARSAWWRGKPSQSRHWFQRWKRASFIQLLFGVMPEPSTAAHGVAQWMASLAASRASRTASPAVSAAVSTNAISGRRRGALSSSHARGSSSSKMSSACSRQGMTKSLAPSAYAETYASLVSRLKRDCSRRQKLAQAMRESGLSSSRWPTAAVTDSNGARNRTSGRSDPNSRHHDGVTLNDAILLWATPTQVHRKSEKAMRPFAQGGGQSSPPGLEQQALGVVNAIGCGCPGRQEIKEQRPQRRTADEWASRPSLFPPGPDDVAGWKAAFASSPELEPAFRRMADGVASGVDVAQQWARVERLRMLGNGVVSLEAGYAFRTLVTRLAARGSAGAAILVRAMGDWLR